MLTGRQLIFDTYCQVMTSQAVRDDAYHLLNVDAVATKLDDYTVRCSVLPQTTILSVTVTGYSPVLLTNFGAAIGAAGTARVNKLYNYFPLATLDSVTLNPDPVSPSHTRDAVLGGVLGLVVGISLAMLKEYLRSPASSLQALAIRSPEVGTYNATYFERRLVEEINRSRLRLRPMSVALILLQPNEDFPLIPVATQNNLLRQAALLLEDIFHDGSIIAYLGKNVFAILLPETPIDQAAKDMNQLYDVIRASPMRFEDYATTFETRIVVLESSGGSLNAQQVMNRALEALRTTMRSPKERVKLIRTTPLPFGGFDLEAPAPEANSQVTETTEFKAKV
jgi:GGDEF domain-containing protein